MPLIVHVGHHALEDSKALTRHAQEIGAAAIAPLAPSFFKPATTADLLDFCAGAAPELPFYYYHIPAMTGVALPVNEFLRAAAGKIPTLAGVKFTFENLLDLQLCLAFEGERFNILFGRDEILLAGLTLGCTGAVGSTYNSMAPIFHRVLTAFQAGDLTTARREQLHAATAISVVSRYGSVAAQKALLKMLGVDCGPARLPLRTLSDANQQALRADLEKINFFAMVGQ